MAIASKKTVAAPSTDELMAYIQKLQAQLEAKNTKPETKGLSLRVSENGTLTISTGFGKTNIKWFYINQADEIFSEANVAKIRDFIKTNRDKFSTGKTDMRFAR